MRQTQHASGNESGSEKIPTELRELALDDQQRRSAICWNVFDD
jgi:hypothetical protein